VKNNKLSLIKRDNSIKISKILNFSLIFWKIHDKEVSKMVSKRTIN
jgi:hypothetical protein